jgi:hypothetical protein
VEQVVRDLRLAARVLFNKEFKEFLAANGDAEAADLEASSFQDKDGKPVLHFHVDPKFLRGLLRVLFPDKQNDVLYNDADNSSMARDEIQRLEKEVRSFREEFDAKYTGGVDLQLASAVLNDLVRGEDENHSRGVPVPALFLRKVTVRGAFPDALVPEGMCLIDMPGTGDSHFLGHYAITHVLQTVHRAAFVMSFVQSIDDIHIRALVEFLRRPERAELRENLVVVKLLMRTEEPVYEPEETEVKFRKELCNRLDVHLPDSLFCVENALFHLVDKGLPIPKKVVAPRVYEKVRHAITEGSDRTYIAEVARMTALTDALCLSFRHKLMQTYKQCTHAIERMRHLIDACRKLDQGSTFADMLCELEGRLDECRPVWREEIARVCSTHCRKVFYSKLKYDSESSSSVERVWNAVFVIPGFLELLLLGAYGEPSAFLVELAEIFQAHARGELAVIAAFFSQVAGVDVYMGYENSAKFAQISAGSLFFITSKVVHSMLQTFTSSVRKDGAAEKEYKTEMVHSVITAFCCSEVSDFCLGVCSALQYLDTTISRHLWTTRYRLQSVIPHYENVCTVLNHVLQLQAPLSSWQASIRATVQSVKPGLVPMDDEWRESHSFCRSLIGFRTGVNKQKVYCLRYVFKHLLELDVGYERFFRYFVPTTELLTIPSNSPGEHDFILRERLRLLRHVNPQGATGDRRLLSFRGDPVEARPSLFIVNMDILCDFLLEHGEVFCIRGLPFRVISFQLCPSDAQILEISIDDVHWALRDDGHILLKEIRSKFHDWWGRPIESLFQNPPLKMVTYLLTGYQVGFSPQVRHDTYRAGSIVQPAAHCVRIDCDNGHDTGTVGGFVAAHDGSDAVFAVTSGHLVLPFRTARKHAEQFSDTFSFLDRVSSKLKSGVLHLSQDALLLPLRRSICISVKDSFHFCMNQQDASYYSLNHKVDDALKSVRLNHDFALINVPERYHDFLAPYCYPFGDIGDVGEHLCPFWPTTKAAAFVSERLYDLHTRYGCRIICCKKGVTTGTTLAMLDVSRDLGAGRWDIFFEPLGDFPCVSCCTRDDKTHGFLTAGGDSGAVWVIDRVIDKRTLRDKPIHSKALRGAIIGLHSVGWSMEDARKHEGKRCGAIYPIWLMIAEIERIARKRSNGALESVWQIGISKQEYASASDLPHLGIYSEDTFSNGL